MFKISLQGLVLNFTYFSLTEIKFLFFGGGLLHYVLKETAKADFTSLVKSCPPILNPVYLFMSMEISINNSNL